MTPVRANVRIIAATHQDLQSNVSEGRFREDLFHRLNVIRIQLPPLRERREDIGLLMRHFLTQAAIELGCEPKIISGDALQRMEVYDWPGNVRQLENTARWLTVMASGKEVHAEDLPPDILSGTGSGADSGVTTGGDHWQAALREWTRRKLNEAGANAMDDQSSILDTALPAFEKILIQAALEHTAGRRQEAARLLGWGRNTLTRKIKELDLESEPAPLDSEEAVS